MTNVPNIEGVPDPRRLAETQQDDTVDPDKFKRLLKVEESDEAQKRNKRQKSRQQEEEEELDPANKEQALPQTAFSAFLAPPIARVDPLSQGEGVQVAGSVAAKMATSPPAGIASDMHSKLELEPATPSIEEQINDAQASEYEQIAKDIELPAAAPLAAIEEIPAVASHSIAKKEEAAAQLAPPLEIPQALPPVAITLSTEVPSYTALSAELFELFEKMLGVLMIEEYKGVSTTTVKLSMPGSVFNGCEVKLEHYDTAPHAFNIQFLGNPEAVDRFNASFPALLDAFANSKLSFQANLQRPALLKEHRASTPRPVTASGDSTQQDNS